MSQLFSCTMYKHEAPVFTGLVVTQRQTACITFRSEDQNRVGKFFSRAWKLGYRTAPAIMGTVLNAPAPSMEQVVYCSRWDGVEEWIDLRLVDDRCHRCGEDCLLNHNF